MSAAKFFESIKLKSVRPGKLISNFDRNVISTGEKVITMVIQSDYGKDESNENRYILKFSSNIAVSEEEKKESNFVNVIFETDYLFDIDKPDLFLSYSQEDITTLSSAMVYLDYRGKLQKVLADVGLGSIKVPLSPREVSSEKEG